jgi:hypothetical protein
MLGTSKPILANSTSRLIALDADGVLLDYHEAYARAWAKAFGEFPALKDPQAYSPWDRWDVQWLSGDRLKSFQAVFDFEFWSTVPAIFGAVEACKHLVEAGFELVCVSALHTEFAEARRQNLQILGFPIDAVIATGASASEISPKASALLRLQPIAFVDDFLPYFRGVHDGVHKALIHRAMNGSPNTGPELNNVHSQHLNLSVFADFWMRRSAVESDS